jgi:hypothetical protein
VDNLWITQEVIHRLSTLQKTYFSACGKPVDNFATFPPVFHRLSTGFPPVIPITKKLGKFYFHVIHRLSTGYPQVIHITKKLEKSCPPVVHRLSTGYPQVIHRIFDFLSKKEILLAKSPFSLFLLENSKTSF